MCKDPEEREIWAHAPAQDTPGVWSVHSRGPGTEELRGWQGPSWVSSAGAQRPLKGLSRGLAYSHLSYVKIPLAVKDS